MAVVTELNVPASIVPAFDAALRLQYKEYYGRIEIGLKSRGTLPRSKFNRNIDNEQRSKAVNAISKLIKPDAHLRFSKSLSDELLNGVLNPAIFTIAEPIQRTEQTLYPMYYPYYDRGPPGWDDPYSPVVFEEFSTISFVVRFIKETT